MPADMITNETWTPAHGWHRCSGTLTPCLGECARRGRFTWTVNGHCPKCDAGPVPACCNAPDVMQLIYFDCDKRDAVVCGPECAAAIVAAWCQCATPCNYGDTGGEAIRMIRAGQIPAVHNCDRCRAPLSVQSPD